MKRSRIILGMATLVVAAFGAFAFTSKATAIPAFYKPGGEGCASAQQETECEIEGMNCVGLPSTVAAGQQLYSDNECEHPLQRPTGF